MSDTATLLLTDRMDAHINAVCEAYFAYLDCLNEQAADAAASGDYSLVLPAPTMLSEHQALAVFRVAMELQFGDAIDIRLRELTA